MKIKMTLLAASAMVSFAGAQTAAEKAECASKCKTECSSTAKNDCKTECAKDGEKDGEKDCSTAAVTHVNVTGMTCGVCSKKLTTALNAVEGVEVKKVCHKSGCVDVVLSNGATAEKVNEVITKSGFKVAPEKKS